MSDHPAQPVVNPAPENESPAPPQPGIATRINPLSARSMAAKSVLARAEKARLLAEEEIAKSLSLAAQQFQSPAPPPTFLSEQRDEMRARMKKLSALMNEEADPSKLDRLASAYAKLADSERILDGRPLPGSHRPASGSARRQPAPAMPQPLD